MFRFLQFSREQRVDGGRGGGLLGAFFAAAGALTAGLAVEQDLDIKFLVVVGAGLADELVAQDLILLALHQLLQSCLIVKIMKNG